MAEDEEEDTRGQGRDHGDTGVHPHDRRVAGSRDESLRDGGTDGGGEEVERLDEGLHAGRGLGVGVFETGDWEIVSFMIEELITYHSDLPEMKISARPMST